MSWNLSVFHISVDKSCSLRSNFIG